MKQKRKRVEITCGCCQSACTLYALPPPEARGDPLEMELFVRNEQESFYLCDECEDGFTSRNVTCYTAHLNDSVVQESSDTDVCKISPYLCSDFVDFESSNNAYEMVREMVRCDSNSLLLVCGAGFSVDSGLNCFRCDSSSDGISSSSKGRLGGSNMKQEDVCYRTRPEKAWYYDASIRRDSLLHKPHNGYYLLQTFLNDHNSNYFILTSNVDAYFRVAEFDETRLCESHGSVTYLQCGESDTDASRCKGVTVCPDELSIVLDDKLEEAYLTTVPHCTSCGKRSRFNISHQPDDIDDIDKLIKSEQMNRLKKWLLAERKKKNGKLIIIEIGCGDSVHGLRLESELLLSGHPVTGIESSVLVRIDPSLKRLPSWRGVFGIKDTAINALTKIFGV